MKTVFILTLLFNGYSGTHYTQFGVFDAMPKCEMARKVMQPSLNTAKLECREVPVQ